MSVAFLPLKNKLLRPGLPFDLVKRTVYQKFRDCNNKEALEIKLNIFSKFQMMDVHLFRRLREILYLFSRNTSLRFREMHYLKIIDWKYG